MNYLALFRFYLGLQYRRTGAEFDIGYLCPVDVILFRWSSHSRS